MDKDNQALRAKLLDILGLTSAQEAVQNEAIANLEAIAQKRFARALPELLTSEQLDHVAEMQDAGKDDDTIIRWVEEQVPDYPQMTRAVMEDVAIEVRDMNKSG
jgi:hypothetical protein